LEESAKIDGANDFVIMFRIVVPLSVATIMVIGLYYAVGIWNAWFHAAIFISKRELFPLQLVLREILITAESSTMAEGMSDVNQDIFLSEIIKYATIIVTIVPILLVYPFIQKYFVKGVMIGAIKG
jgi:putative aldouronate transport system permease protein